MAGIREGERCRVSGGGPPSVEGPGRPTQSTTTETLDSSATAMGDGGRAYHGATAMAASATGKNGAAADLSEGEGVR
jgi:hypothetical protein